MIHFLVLSSGSCGNSYAFYDGRDTIVIDQGLTYTGFSKRLLLHEIPLESVRAIFLTHLHPDHSKGVGATARKLGIPVYLSNVSMHASHEVIKKIRISDESLHPFAHPSHQLNHQRLKNLRHYRYHQILPAHPLHPQDRE